MQERMQFFSNSKMQLHLQNLRQCCNFSIANSVSRATELTFATEYLLVLRKLGQMDTSGVQYKKNFKKKKMI